LRGELAKAWEAYKKLEPLRRSLEKVTLQGKTHASYKYWTQFLGMAGGDSRLRVPLLELTEPEKRAIQAAVETTGLI
jgi:dihydrodipicolinate synthase/N-acetylneuraminate lyase